MVTADFRLEAKFTLFLLMRTKDIAKSLKKMYADRKSTALLQEIEVSRGNGRVRFLTGSY